MDHRPGTLLRVMGIIVGLTTTTAIVPYHGIHPSDDQRQEQEQQDTTTTTPLSLLQSSSSSSNEDHHDHVGTVPCLVLDDGSGGSPAILGIPPHIQDNAQFVSSWAPGLVVDCIVQAHVQDDDDKNNNKNNNNCTSDNNQIGTCKFWIDSLTLWTSSSAVMTTDQTKRHTISFCENDDLNLLNLRGIEIQMGSSVVGRISTTTATSIATTTSPVRNEQPVSSFYPVLSSFSAGMAKTTTKGDDDDNVLKNEIYEMIQSCTDHGGATIQELAHVLDLMETTTTTTSNDDEHDDKNYCPSSFQVLQDYLSQLQLSGHIYLNDQGFYFPL